MALLVLHGTVARGLLPAQENKQIELCITSLVPSILPTTGNKRF